MSDYQYQTVEQVQERLKISHDTVNRLIGRGEIKAVKIGRCVRIESTSVDRYLQAHTIGKTTDKEV